jgi:hypothetical protein
MPNENIQFKTDACRHGNATATLANGTSSRYAANADRWPDDVDVQALEVGTDRPNDPTKTLQVGICLGFRSHFSAMACNGREAAHDYFFPGA